MTQVLVQVNDNWADEMDIYGWTICDKDWLDNYLKDIEKYFKNGGEPLIHWVGTNEEIYYRNYDDVFRTLKIKELTDEEAKTIESLFGSDSRGDTPSLDLEIEEE